MWQHIQVASNRMMFQALVEATRRPHIVKLVHSCEVLSKTIEKPGFRKCTSITRGTWPDTISRKG